MYVIQPSGGYNWIPRKEYPGPLLPFRDPYHLRAAPYGAPFSNSRMGSVAKPYVLERQGPGYVFPAGFYTGQENRNYVIQIEEGGKPGRDTFRWSDQWKDGFDQDVKVKRWNATGVPIPRLGPDQRSERVNLNDGISIWFSAKPDARFKHGHTFHFKVYAAMNEAVWGEISVPAGTLPGIYEGVITVRALDRDPVYLPLTLTVWDFELPLKNSFTTAFGGWMVKGFYDQCPDANLQYESMLHRHRIDISTIQNHHTTWRRRFAIMDWTSFDQQAARRLDGSAFKDGRPINRFQLGMYGCGNEWNWEGDADQKIKNVRLYGKLFAEHLKNKGWFDQVYMYCRDEPLEQQRPNIIRDIQAFLEGAPGWKGKFMVTSMPSPGNPLLDWIDIWSVKYHWWIDPALKADLLQQGKEFWCYVANSPYSPNPGYHTDSLKGYEPRLIKWAAWKMGAKGFLYWAGALDQAYPNPWTTAMNDFAACGDANLIYYGARNGPLLEDNATPLPPIMGPVADFRLKQIREGLEDWEYLLLCEKKRGRAFTEAIANDVYRSPGGPYGKYVKPAVLDRSWTQDDQMIYRARRKLARAILETTSP